MDVLILDLIEKMLVIEPNKRIQAKEALAHPFFTEEPLPCDKSEIPVGREDAHEYLIRQRNKSKEVFERVKLE